jgi:hypothetical protein
MYRELVTLRAEIDITEWLLCLQSLHDATLYQDLLKAGPTSAVQAGLLAEV